MSRWAVTLTMDHGPHDAATVTAPDAERALRTVTARRWPGVVLDSSSLITADSVRLGDIAAAADRIEASSPAESCD